SALWGLLPVIAKDQLGLSSSGYGLLLGALGVGAVCGAFLLSRLRSQFGQNILLTVGAAGFAVATAVLAL
ncbi:MFS transporter, partial [Mycobacterium sp. ITM-2017-0098]